LIKLLVSIRLIKESFPEPTNAGRMSGKLPRGTESGMYGNGYQKIAVPRSSERR